MTKKWLYSVAVGTLLMAGEALGITVHDVLSNGFWSAEQRGTEGYLTNVTTSAERVKKYKKTQDKEGNWKVSKMRVIKSSVADPLRWKGKCWYNIAIKDEFQSTDLKEKLTTNRNKTHKEKTLIYQVEDINTMGMGESITNRYVGGQTTYTVKPLKKDVRPMGPFVVDDWFPNSIEKSRGVRAQFYGTEENAVTNIVSDNEVYITRTVEQTGYIFDYKGYPVNKDASLSRTCKTSIKTDDDHVYVHQRIYEKSSNDPFYSSNTIEDCDYIATFKKGQWKGSTETIGHFTDQQAADWYLNYLKQKQTTRVSSQQPDHWTMNQRPRQNSR